MKTWPIVRGKDWVIPVNDVKKNLKPFITSKVLKMDTLVFLILHCFAILKTTITRKVVQKILYINPILYIKSNFCGCIMTKMKIHAQSRDYETLSTLPKKFNFCFKKVNKMSE